jgi:hypothetical protein
MLSEVATVAASFMPATPRDIGHRGVQSVVLGVGILSAVSPWFKAQPLIAVADAERRAPPPADPERAGRSATST